MSDELLQTDGHAVVLGQTGLGKTALLRALIRRAGRRAWPRILIADPVGEFGAVAVAVRSVPELAGYLERAGESWRVAYQGDDLDEAFPVLCEAAYRMGRCLLVVDEADLWCSPAAIEPEFAHALKYGRWRPGRREGVIVLAAARRPSEVHRLLTSQARCVASFGTVEPVDLDYLRRAVSVEFAAALPDLPPLVCAWWDRRARVVRRLRVDPVADRLEELGAPPPPAVGPEEAGAAAPTAE